MNATLRFLGRYARRNLRQYTIGAIALLATNYAVVRIPALMGQALNVLERDGAAALADARGMAVELMLLALAVIGVRTLSRALFFNPGREIEFRLGIDLFERLLGLQRPFFNRRKVGELVSIASNDTTAVRLLVGFAGLQVCNVAVAIPMHLFQMLSTDVELTLWCLAPVAFGAAYMRWTVKRFFAMVRDGMQLLARLSDRVLESYAGIGTVRSHAAEDATMRRFDERNQVYLDLQLRVSAIRAFGMPVLAFSGLAGTGVVLWAGGNRVLQGELGVGDLATFTALLVSLVGTLTSLAWVLAAVGRGMIATDRVAELLHTPDELPAVEHQLEIHAPPRLELRHLSFCYEGTETPALQDIELTIEPGRTLGVFGKTGSGKTTLVNLVARVYTPPKGTVWIDGVDASTVPLSALREAMAVVPQTPFLFSTRLRDNITLADANPRARRGRKGEPREPDPPDPRLDEVLDAASLTDDIAHLPQGLDTVVGERGVMLSGGQRQRAALARALYRQRPVLVLDDVLSAVDQGTEAKMVAAIRALRAGQDGGSAPTTIIVSHRTSVLEHVDEIIVLDGGRVVERGTHQDLLRQRGLYAETHAHQEGSP
ncbi:MAG: ABC transporter ATP-binding protein [Deltaproteobacteria bacterium]|nr:ABC transporter ATP-binding protein [Deltaproteobacteria bacterium]MBK8236057.1 ABC transporter ATP-binding protein [Deltaproteobacteria bacterium]MBP7288848.1 ABC transporter ATP-binding protein [Nannocystaceae bacterium]